MSVLPDQKLMCRRFSDAAEHYGGLANIQRTIVRDLVKKIDHGRGARVLDVGAGDGALASELLHGGARVVALDMAWGMARQGKAMNSGAVWVQADACALPFAREIFDHVVSSSAYQWVEDLPLAFAQARRVLKPGRAFTAAMFGHATLNELFTSLQRGAGRLGRPLPPLKRLARADDVRAALGAAGFRDVAVTAEERTAGFKDMAAILAWLKGVGANVLTPRFFLGKALLKAAAEEYRMHFTRDEALRVTFEVIWIEANA